MAADTYIAHPLRDDPEAEFERPDSDYAECATCRSERVKEVMDADGDCPKCVKKFHLVERFNARFGFDLPWKFTSLHCLESYCRMTGANHLADDIHQHVNFYTPAPLSAAGKPLTAKPEAVPSAGGGK